MLDNSFEDDMQRTVAAGAAEDAGPAVAVEDDIDVDVEWLDDEADGTWLSGPEDGAGEASEDGVDGDPEDSADLDDYDEDPEEIGYDDYLLCIIDGVKSDLESDGIEPSALAEKVNERLNGELDSPVSSALAGNSKIAEALGDLYMNEMLFNCGRLGLSVEECRRQAIGFLYKAVCDVGYPARGECAFRLAMLFYAPRYEAPDLKQAKEWFGLAARELKNDPGKAAEAWLYLGRIAEAEGDYGEAARCRKRHDALSGDRRGEAEQARLLIVSGLDPTDGLATLKSLAEDGEPYAAIILAELPWTLSFSDEMDDGFPYDEIEEWLERDCGAVADARGALGGYLLAAEDYDGYLESPEEESFYQHLVMAYGANSVVASYYFGKFYTQQCGSAIDAGRSEWTVSDLAQKALFYLKQAAGLAYMPAMKDYATVNSLCHGFDADTAKYCSFLQIFGETDHAQDLLSRKEELDKDKLFID